MNRCQLLIAAALLLLPAVLLAQGATSVTRAEIPFQFLVGDQVLPAGSYMVKFDTNYRQVHFQSPQSTATVFLLAKSVARPHHRDSENGLLVFYQYGNVYALRNVWNPRQEKGYVAPVSKVERELARKMPATETVVGTH